MINVDALYSAFITALTGDATIAALVPAGWRQGRHQQTSPATGNYGLIQISPGSILQSSSFIKKTYTVTLQVYANASATAQAAIQAGLAALLDYKPDALVNPTGGSINMIAPTSIDQKVADDMRSGVDVVPVACSWTFTTIETRA